MVYQYVNGTLAGQNVMYLFGYANSITSGLFVLFTVIAFFLIILIGSYVMQIRFGNNPRFEISLLASSFSTLGLCIIIEQITGLLPAPYFITFAILTVLSFLWMAMTNE